MDPNQRSVANGSNNPTSPLSGTPTQTSLSVDKDVGEQGNHRDCSSGGAGGSNRRRNHGSGGPRGVGAGSKSEF